MQYRWNIANWSRGQRTYCSYHPLTTHARFKVRCPVVFASPGHLGPSGVHPVHTADRIFQLQLSPDQRFKGEYSLQNYKVHTGKNRVNTATPRRPKFKPSFINVEIPRKLDNILKNFMGRAGGSCPFIVCHVLYRANLLLLLHCSGESNLLLVYYSGDPQSATHPAINSSSHHLFYSISFHSIIYSLIHSIIHPSI